MFNIASIAEFYFVEALLKTVYSLTNFFYDLFCILLSPQILSPIQIFVCTWFRCDFSKCFLYFSVVSHSQTSSEFFVCVFFWFRLVANLMFNYYEVCVLRFFFSFFSFSLLLLFHSYVRLIWHFRQSQTHGKCLSAYKLDTEQR